MKDLSQVHTGDTVDIHGYRGAEVIEAGNSSVRVRYYCPRNGEFIRRRVTSAEVTDHYRRGR